MLDPGIPLDSSFFLRNPGTRDESAPPIALGIAMNRSTNHDANPSHNPVSVATAAAAIVPANANAEFNAFVKVFLMASPTPKTALFTASNAIVNPFLIKSLTPKTAPVTKLKALVKVFLMASPTPKTAVLIPRKSLSNATFKSAIAPTTAPTTAIIGRNGNTNGITALATAPAIETIAEITVPTIGITALRTVPAIVQIELITVPAIGITVLRTDEPIVPIELITVLLMGPIAFKTFPDIGPMFVAISPNAAAAFPAAPFIPSPKTGSIPPIAPFSFPASGINPPKNFLASGSEVLRVSTVSTMSPIANSGAAKFGAKLLRTIPIDEADRPSALAPFDFADSNGPESESAICWPFILASPFNASRFSPIAAVVAAHFNRI